VPVVKRAWAALVGAVPVDEVAVAGEAAAITIENTVSQEPGHRRALFVLRVAVTIPSGLPSWVLRRIFGQ
jgi:hypothetical protein